MSSCPGESVKIYKTVKTDSFLNPAAASLPPHILVLNSLTATCHNSLVSSLSTEEGEEEEEEQEEQL